MDGFTTLKAGDGAKVRPVREYLAQTTGSLNMTKHALLRGFAYSDGVGILAESCGAHWLIDLIARHQRGVLRKLRKLGERNFQVWQLDYETNKDGWATKPKPWVARCWTDTPGAMGSARLAVQRFEFSDMPRELLPLKLWVEGDFSAAYLMFPEEH